MSYASGDKYNGGWKNGNWHGDCKITWTNGISFEGFLDQDNYTTKGKFTYPDKSYYDGECKDYWTKHGRGKHVHSDRFAILLFPNKRFLYHVLYYLQSRLRNGRRLQSK